VKTISWLILVAVAAGIGFAFWRWRRLEEERNRTAEERLRSFVAQAAPSTQTAPAVQAMPLVDAGSLQQQRLLLEAASKAGAAGEAVLSIQLYARLLSRYPQSSFAAQARAAVEEQKKKLAKP
jgi:hypothetical protein